MKSGGIAFAALACLTPLSAARADAPTDVTVIKGACQASSVTQSGSAKPFACDNAIFAFYDNENSHIMIQFTEKGDDSAGLVGFAGIMAKDGVTLNADRIYLVPNYPLTAQEASCKLSFTKPAAPNDRPNITGIACKGSAAQSAVTVDFKPDPGQ